MNKEEYKLYVQDIYDKLMLIKEERGISYGEINHIENLTDKELHNLEKEIIKEIMRIEQIIKEVF